MRVTGKSIFVLLISAGISLAAVKDQALVSNCVQLLHSTSSSVGMRCDLKDLQHEPVEINGELRSSLSIPGEPTTYFPGMPVLPSVTRFVVVPPVSNLELVVTPTEPRRVRAEHPPLLLQGEENESVERELPTDIFPPVVAEMDSPFIIRGVRMVKVTTYPVRYDFRTNEYLQYESIETEVRSIAGEAVSRRFSPPEKVAVRSFLAS